MKKKSLLKDDSFPDLNKDGEVTYADVLIGRGVREEKAIGGVIAKALSKSFAKKNPDVVVAFRDMPDKFSVVNNPEKLKTLNSEDANQALEILQAEKRQQKNMPEIKMYGEVERKKVLKEIDSNYEESINVLKDIIRRESKADGGDIDGQMTMLMMPEEQEEDMLPDDEMEDEYLDFILDEALDNEEEDFLMDALQGNDRLSMIFDKVIDVAQEFAGSGPVEGPGSGVSDSIPARLSDGEFVFTAKAVEEIGSDNLMSMMKDAEARADERQEMQEGGDVEEETVTMQPDEQPVVQEIRVVKETVDSPSRMIADEDEISKGIKSKMMLDPMQRHVRS